MPDSQTIILNSEKDKNFKAILSLKRIGKSNLKFFNGKMFGKNLALGIKQNKNITKIPLMLSNNNSEFELPKSFDINSKAMCAVVDITNAFCPELVLCGSTNSSFENEKIESAFVQTKPQDTSVLYSMDTDEEIESLISKNLEDDEKSVYFDGCKNCKYRTFFYENGKTLCCDQMEQKDKPIKEINISSHKEDDHEDKSDKKINNSFLDNNSFGNQSNDQNFYDNVKDQISGIFEKYSRETILENIIPNSKWARVNYDGDENYYVLGLIYEDERMEKVKYICYGVPSQSKSTPPDDIKDIAQWVPVDTSKIDSNGYFICYQDALNGESIIVNLI